MSKRILIVDDSKAMRLIVRRTLRQAGFGEYTVDEAQNGSEALQMIRDNAPNLRRTLSNTFDRVFTTLRP